PHGWTPILISATVFGLAHVGHGVAPVALVLFGIVLGYLYQRTHRLVPCITAHMLFNGYSMLQLWLQLQASPAG
ncbi:MAG: CPBP family intramembrane glutamic endopeptidase, partial [Bythopirellula sp.]